LPYGSKPPCLSSTLQDDVLVAAHLRYLHHRGLAGCVPSMRRWKLATLPGLRDFAILMMLDTASISPFPLGQPDHAYQQGLSR
jgi:hypothetical protein